MEISWKKEKKQVTEYLRYSDWEIGGILFFLNPVFSDFLLMKDKKNNIIISGAGKE
jgi:hypothetical protein